jgi:hypothetical protein
MKRGRPTQDPRGKKRKKLQPWVSDETEFALRYAARTNNTTVGHVLDQWFKDRAGAVTRISATLTKRLDATQKRVSDTQLDQQPGPQIDEDLPEEEVI